MKTKYKSYNLNGLPTGCKYCVKGEKLVLFITGICRRNCWYCSLSSKRKNKDIIWLNERKYKDYKDIINEVIESNATSAGITGGDPLIKLDRTIKFAKILKKHFKNKFHIHIYIPTKNITDNKLKKLSKYIDEIRFHPEFLINKNPKIIDKDIKKIQLANKYWKKENIGIELPVIPEKKHEIFSFILKIKDHVGFVNLNELEISETNFNIMTKKYNFNDSGYVIKSSKSAGLYILKQLKQNKIKLKVHFCTAELKNNFQFKNRLRLHNILPFGYKTSDGLVKYLVIENINNKLIKDIKNKINKQFYIDKQKERIILSESGAKKLLKENKYKIFLVEEFPTDDGIEVEKQEI